MANSSSMSGRSTLTATSRPSVVTARWTWAIEAAPTGTSSNSEKRLSSGAPNERLDGLLDLGERRGRQVVLQLRQVRRGFLADQVGPGRQRLAELDRRRADRDQRRRHNRGVGGMRAPKRAIARQPAHRRRRDADRRSMPRSAPCRASVRPHFSKRHRWVTRGGQIFQPEWMVTSPPSIGSAAARTKPASATIALNACGRGKRRMLSTR